MITGTTIGLVSYAAAAAGFAFLSMLLLASWKRGRVGAWLMGASAVTAIWAAVESYDSVSGGNFHLTAALFDVLRMASWIVFLLIVMSFSWDLRRARTGRDLVAPAILTLCVLNAIIEVASAGVIRQEWTVAIPDIRILSRLSLAIVGLLLIENLFRNTSPQRRWNIKFLCFGVGGMFAYDFFLYSEALLYKRISPELADARGFINAIVVPLIAISAARNPHWSIEVFVSRRAIFHSSTLIGAGIYLLAMAVAGYFLRRYSGDWGPILQAVFLFGAVILLVLVVFSGRFRAWARINLNKHFLTYRYDYREEWLRLIRTISSIGIEGGMPVRVINAVADVVDSPDGALWLRQEGERFALDANWNTSSWRLDPEAGVVDPILPQFLEERQWVINLDEFAERPEMYYPLVLPEWLTNIRRAWLLVPLLHHDWLLGFLVLGQPRGPRDMNWEDYDLLRTIGRQAASYLAEHQAARALADARQFEQFNKRFAFVLHDVKNLVSQLSLMLTNAEKYRGNPAFFDDMIATVKESVDKMNRLMVRLHEGGRAAKANAALDLAGVLRHTIARTEARGRRLSFDCKAEGMVVVADEDRLTAVVAHLIDNAIDATTADGKVAVRLFAQGSDAVIEIEDNGKGMDLSFVRDELFQPFKSTKSGGYGIGAYESREFVRELGGKLDVVSAPGKGTTVRIRLPAIGGDGADVATERRAEVR